MMAEEDNLDYSTIVAELRKCYKSGVMRSIESRLEQLKQFNRMLAENEEELYDAVYKDLHKNKVEANLMEMLLVRVELGNAIASLKQWMMPERVSADLVNKMNVCELRREALGVVLIISAWNYPIQVTLLPMVGALAAGNCVVVKPSELSVHTSSLMAKLLQKYLSPSVVQVVSGGVSETTALLREKFDLIFYTGSPGVAKFITRAAAEHLTPTVLELGGKCPAIIDATCDMNVIAQRICWAKFCNSGQTCLAVDYVLCIGDCQSAFIEAMKTAITKFYGDNPKECASYGRIINKRHFERVTKLIDESKVVLGNETDADDLYISPTILSNVTKNDDIMKQENEIFGPLLPLVNVASVDEAISFVNDYEKPLALYVFSNDYALTEKVSNETSSGGMCVNDAIVQAGCPNLPFGGVGHSGMGRYHGKSSFETFSNVKSYLYKSLGMEYANAIRYPPYDDDWVVWKFAKWMLTPSV